MPKKHKRDRHQHEQPDHPPPLEPVQPTPEQREIDTWTDQPTPPKTSPPLTDLLETIRADAKSSRHHTAQTISELEAMRAEIDAAIAFLKAGRR
jgi:hypothetical protein